MKKAFIIVMLLVLGIAVGSTVTRRDETAAEKSQNTRESLVLSSRYESEAHSFGFNYPSDYQVRELTDGINDVVTVEDDAGDGIQILISPFDDSGAGMTKERILADIPDMRIEDEQPVEIGVDGRGIAFISDNESFGGESREVWFVFDGRLYQISTRLANDTLLQAIFGTWQFTTQ